jgi:hypothetical protein
VWRWAEIRLLLATRKNASHFSRGPASLAAIRFAHIAASFRLSIPSISCVQKKKHFLRSAFSFVHVDLVSENWNQLHSWVFEASEAILSDKQLENIYI